jgi:hypothetical protein
MAALFVSCALAPSCQPTTAENATLEGTATATRSSTGLYCEDAPSLGDNLDPLSPDALTFSTLKSLILTRDIRSVDQLLQFFAAHPVYKGLLENPVLNKRSHALHAADVSPQFPRLLLHQHRMVMMMVTDESKVSSEQLEIQEYVPERHQYKFRLVNFAVFGQPTMFVEDAGNTTFNFLDNGEAIQLAPYTDPSFAGVGSCDACHDRADSGYHPWLDDRYILPRWSVSPVWTPAFGERSSHEEPTQWQKFEETYADPIKGKRFRILPPIHVEKSPEDVYLADRPNLALTNHFNRMNFHRIASYLTSNERWEGLQFATVAAFLGCESLPGFLPEPYASLHPAPNSVATAATEVWHDAVGNLDAFVSEEPLVDKLVYLFGKSVLQLWGTAADDIYTGRVRDASFSSSEGGLPGLMACEVGPGFLRAHPELNRFAKNIVDARFLEIPKEDYCGMLREKSLAVIASQPWASNASPPPGPPYTLGFQMDCSVDGHDVEIDLDTLSAPTTAPSAPRTVDGRLAISFFEANHTWLATERHDLRLTLASGDPRRTLHFSTATSGPKLCFAELEASP